MKMEPIKAYLTKEGWKRDWEQTTSRFQDFGKRLHDFLDDFLDNGATARFNEKQAFLHLLDLVEMEAREYKAQLALSERKVVTSQGVMAVIPPYLAFPEIYATSPAQPLETRISNIDGLY